MTAALDSAKDPASAFESNQLLQGDHHAMGCNGRGTSQAIVLVKYGFCLTCHSLWLKLLAVPHWKAARMHKLMGHPTGSVTQHTTIGVCPGQDGPDRLGPPTRLHRTSRRPDRRHIPHAHRGASTRGRCAAVVCRRDRDKRWGLCRYQSRDNGGCSRTGTLI